MEAITYATKVWEGEFEDVLARHPKVQLLIGNNLKTKHYTGKAKFIDIGSTPAIYYAPELEAVKQCKTEYLLWYANDVIIPPTDWLPEALELLKTYPIVTTAPHNILHVEDVRGFNEHDTYYECYHFSDQCYVARADYMRAIDYDRRHKILDDYPFPDTFEARVGAWLATEETPLAVLRNHIYHHIDKREKGLLDD